MKIVSRKIRFIRLILSMLVILSCSYQIKYGAVLKFFPEEGEHDVNNNVLLCATCWDNAKLSVETCYHSINNVQYPEVKFNVVPGNQTVIIIKGEYPKNAAKGLGVMVQYYTFIIEMRKPVSGDSIRIDDDSVKFIYSCLNTKPDGWLEVGLKMNGIVYMDSIDTAFCFGKLYFGGRTIRFNNIVEYDHRDGHIDIRSIKKEIGRKAVFISSLPIGVSMEKIKELLRD